MRKPIELRRPGMASILRARAGTAKLCITSIEETKREAKEKQRADL
jgi:hypothetical protein